MYDENYIFISKLFESQFKINKYIIERIDLALIRIAESEQKIKDLEDRIRNLEMLS